VGLLAAVVVVVEDPAVVVLVIKVVGMVVARMLVVLDVVPAEADGQVGSLMTTLVVCRAVHREFS
jgi:hypothetical protein